MPLLLQLGWNSADLLNNKRDIFIFQGTPYFPRPDHISPFESVSMSWAGVHSENLASVWLTAHLCDHLNAQQFREVAEKLGLAPYMTGTAEEPYTTYRGRIRDRHGIQISDEVLRSAAYNSAITSLEADFIFEGMVDEYRMLKKLHYGLGFEKIRERVYREFANGQAGRFTDERQELSLRQKILSESFLALGDLRRKFRAYILQAETPLGPSSRIHSVPVYPPLNCILTGLPANITFRASSPPHLPCSVSAGRNCRRFCRIRVMRTG